MTDAQVIHVDLVYPEHVLEEAAQFRNECKQRGTHPDWNDYEYFKHKLIDYGYFGYESKLADALDL